MGQTTLVNQMVEDGQKLVNHLIQESLPVSGAFWMKTSEEGQYYLYIVTPLAHGTEILAAYRRVSMAIRMMPQPFWVGPFDVKLIRPDSRIGKAFVKENQIGKPLPTNGSDLPTSGGVIVEGFYPYPLVPVATP